MTTRLSIPLAALVILAACDQRPSAPEATTEDMPVAFGAARAPASIAPNFADMANDKLAAIGSEYRVAYAEYITYGPSGLSGNIIVARDVGNKRFDDHFIPNDPRRVAVNGDPNTIDILVDQIDGATANGLTEATTTAAITRAMQTWEGQTCSDPGISVTPIPLDLGLVQGIFGYGAGFAFSDIMHAGWLPGSFFDLLIPGGSTSVLGVTITLFFVTGDLDGNGRPDLGAREIYYNDAFPWADNGVSNVDVESVALHETGHGLSQDHFGTVFINPNSGRINFSPLAVMNAVYAAPQRGLKGTDVAGHCGIWAKWPN